MDRRWPAKPRLLYEQPGCRGTESSLTSCERWSERQLGGGVCGTVLTEPINVDVVVASVKDHRHRFQIIIPILEYRVYRATMEPRERSNIGEAFVSKKRCTIDH